MSSVSSGLLEQGICDSADMSAVSTVVKSRSDGAVVFWSVTGDTSQSKLSAELANIGYPNFVPKNRAYGAVLQSAISETCPSAPKGQKYLCRKDADGKVLCVLETIGSQSNEYSIEFGAEYDRKTGTILYFGNKVPDYDRREAVADLVRTKLDSLSPQQGTRYLEMLVERLSGIQLQKSGVNWIPRNSLQKWRAVCVAFRNASQGNKFYCLESVITEDTIEAIVDSLKTETLRECEEIKQAIGRDNISFRGLESLRERAKLAQEKIKSYEALTERSLKELTDAIDSITTTFVQVSMAT